MSVPVTHVVHVLPSLNTLAQAFNLRLTPPFADADTDAQVSVLSHVRAGYSNGDQLPKTWQAVNGRPELEVGYHVRAECKD